MRRHSQRHARGLREDPDDPFCLKGLPLRWRTRITAWEEGRAFEDVQERGPYALWHHRHAFEDLPGGGTRMTDTVRYRLPLGLLGLLALPLVRRDVARIFAYRRQVLEIWARDRASACDR